MRALFNVIVLAGVLIIWGVQPYNFRLEDGRLNVYAAEMNFLTRDGEIPVPVTRFKNPHLPSLTWTTTASAKVARVKQSDINGLAIQPIGHYEFCQRHPKECQATLFTQPVLLTQERMDELNRVNTWVRNYIREGADIDVHQAEEYWASPSETMAIGVGDCDDHVILKRQILIDRGWPVSTLLITVVFAPDGTGHAVLTVRARNSLGNVDLILDNLEARILKREDTEYRYLKRQSPHHAGKWEQIGIDPFAQVAGTN